MDVNLLSERFPKKVIDLSEILEPGDFITLRPIPMKRRYSVLKMRSKGIDVNKVMEAKEAGKELSDREAVSALTDDFDGGAEYRVELVALSIDPDNHSFTDKGEKIHLSKGHVESWADNIPELFNLIYQACQKYYDDYTVGKAAAGR